MNYDFPNQVSTEEQLEIAKTLWSMNQDNRKYGELENTAGLISESVETYLRFLKSVREVPVIKFENVFEDDGLANADVYYVCLIVSGLVAIIVHDMSNDDWYVSNSKDSGLIKFMTANY